MLDNEPFPSPSQFHGQDSISREDPCGNGHQDDENYKHVKHSIKNRIVILEKDVLSGQKGMREGNGQNKNFCRQGEGVDVEKDGNKVGNHDQKNHRHN